MVMTPMVVRRMLTVMMVTSVWGKEPTGGVWILTSAMTRGFLQILLPTVASTLSVPTVMGPTVAPVSLVMNLLWQT